MPKLLVNNREVQTQSPLGSPLVDFLRNDQRLHGTKIGCREGDCGACTVLLGELRDGAMRYRAVASCLTPLGNAVGKHVVTLEGINREDLTVVQETFIEMSATQCGFCTPGFLLSVYGFCLGERPHTLENALEAVAGNICRCTGYASIKRAVEALVARIQPLDRRDPLRWLVEQRFLPEYFLGVPERMRGIAPDTIRAIPDAGYVLAGGSDLLIQDFEGASDADPVRLLAGVEAFRQIRIQDGTCELGAACTLTEIKESPELNELIPGLDGYLGLMASHPIRNMGTVGGNIANASPLGDLCVILMGLDASLVLSLRNARREMPLRHFFMGYKKTCLEPGEIIERIRFAQPDGTTRFSFEKASKRKHLDMATVNSSLRVRLEGGIIQDATLAAGSLGPTVFRLEAASRFLAGRRIDNETFREVNRIAQLEIAPLSRHPGDGDHKRSLLRQQLFLHLMKFSPETVTVEALK